MPSERMELASRILTDLFTTVFMLPCTLNAFLNNLPDIPQDAAV